MTTTAKATKEKVKSKIKPYNRNNLVLRVSQYQDYVAIDEMDDIKERNIISTPFYLQVGRKIQLHSGMPSSHRCDYPSCYEDYNDFWEFELGKNKKGKLCILMNWLNGPCFENSSSIEVDLHEFMADFNYHTKIEEM